MKLTDQEIDDIKQTAPVYVSAKAVNAIVTMVEAKLTAKREWVGLTDEEIKEMLGSYLFWGEGSSEHIRFVEAKLKEKNT